MGPLGKDSSAARVALPLSLAMALSFGAVTGRAQLPAEPPVAPTSPAPSAGAVSSALPAGAANAVATDTAVAVLPSDVQVVRFEGPPEVRIEVVGPAAEPLPLGDGRATGLFGFKVGVGYQLRLSNIPGRPDAELFPMVEVVGHLHRPDKIDPFKFPIRVAFSEDDFLDVVDHGQLVTQIVYLEDPDTALPISLPKNEIPVVTLNPAEEPLKVASALGRVMVIVRLGGRKPTTDDLNRGDLGASMVPVGGAHCPFTGAGGSACALPCGPGRGSPPPRGQRWLPRDEYLCDGGDHAEPLHFEGDGALRGIDPRDAAIRFSDDRRPRILPTNMVCIYAPRFAEIRVASGPNEALRVEGPLATRASERQALEATRQGPVRFVQNQAPEANRHRARASSLRGRVLAGETAELRVLSGMDNVIHISRLRLVQEVHGTVGRQKPGSVETKIRQLQINTSESAVVTGVVQGAGATVMSWPAHEEVGVEVPPKRPGLAVIKRVSTGEAEPGDIVTYVIQYRNMGNTPIRAVSVVDSLLPRLEYVPGSALGPAGTVFSSAENRVGSTELRWDLPGVVPPGQEGSVSFQVKVR